MGSRCILVEASLPRGSVCLWVKSSWSLSSDKLRQRRARNGPAGDLSALAPAQRGPTSVIAAPCKPPQASSVRCRAHSPKGGRNRC